VAEKRQRFAVIDGEGKNRSGPKAELIALPPVRKRSEQMMLAAWPDGGTPGRLLSIGFDALDYHGFHSVLTSSGVRHVIDIRSLASFRGRGFAPDVVERAFRELGVTYMRCHDLANPYIATSLNPHLVLGNYRAHLQDKGAETLRRIADILLRGSVLVLGRDASHFGSERELLVDCLAEFHRPIELVVFSTCRRVAVSASSYLLAPVEPHVDDSPSVTKKRKSVVSKRQLMLPGAGPERRR